MRHIVASAIIIVLTASCRKEPPAGHGVTPPRPDNEPPPAQAGAVRAAEPTVTVSEVAALLPGDIGASKAGRRLVVPAMHELEVNVIVLRKGVLSTDESYTERRGADHESAHDVSCLVLEPRGVLRPDSADYLVVLPFGGRWLRSAGDCPLRMSGGETQPRLRRGQRTELFCLLFDSGTSFRGDTCDLKIAVRARVIPIDPEHPHYAECQKEGGLQYNESEDFAENMPEDLESEFRAPEGPLSAAHGAAGGDTPGGHEAPVLRPRLNGPLVYGDSFDTADPLCQPLFGGTAMAFTNTDGMGRLTSMSAGVVGAVYTEPRLRDLIAEVDLQPPADVGDSSYGLMFRSDYRNGSLPAYYALLVHPRNMKVTLSCWQDPQWTLAQEYPLAPGLVSAGRACRARLEAVGPEFRVFLNGVFVCRLVDDKLNGPGTLGLLLVSEKAGKTAAIFDNLRVYEPGPEGGQP